MKVAQKISVAKKEPKSYGQITLNSANFPGVKDLTLGDKQNIMVSVDIRSLSKPDRWQISEEGMKPTDVIARINILGVTLPTKAMKKKMDKKEDGDDKMDD